VEARRISVTIRIFKQAVLKKFNQHQQQALPKDKEEATECDTDASHVAKLTNHHQKQENGEEQKIALTKCVCYLFMLWSSCFFFFLFPFFFFFNN
jgi:hypothetical protein